MIYGISNGILSANVSTLGGELVSLRKDGKERLWQNDNGSWRGHAPILFPVSGDCTMIVDGKQYPIKKHGFARKTEFYLVGMSKEEITLGFKSSEETKAVYPYDFEFHVTYRVKDSTLEIFYDVFNPTDAPIYAMCGCHESYALAEEVGKYEVLFNKNEVFDSYIYDEPNAGLKREVVKFGDGKYLAFPQKFLNTDCLIFKDMNSTEVVLRKIGGKKIAKLKFEGFKNFLFWHPLGSKMICMEPWHNLPDFVDEKNVEFPLKNGAQEIPPKSKKRFTHSIEYLDFN